MGLMAPLAAPKILKLTGAKRVGYLGVNDDYGRSFNKSFQDQFGKAGASTVAEIYFERGNTDFMAFLNQLKAAKPDIVLYVGTASEGAMILKQAQEIGITPGIKFIGSEEMGEMELVSLAGAEAVDGTYAVALWGAVASDFEKKVKDKFNAPMHYAIIFGYDALKVMVDAIQRAKSLDTDGHQGRPAEDRLQGSGRPDQVRDLRGLPQPGALHSFLHPVEGRQARGHVGAWTAGSEICADTRGDSPRVSFHRKDPACCCNRSSTVSSWAPPTP